MNFVELKQKIQEDIIEVETLIKMVNEILNAECQICGNVSSYDKQSLKGSTWNINGCKVVLCCPCEDELLVKIAKGRGIKITLGDGGEVEMKRFIINVEEMPEEVEAETLNKAVELAHQYIDVHEVDENGKIIN